MQEYLDAIERIDTSRITNPRDTVVSEYRELDGANSFLGDYSNEAQRMAYYTQNGYDVTIEPGSTGGSDSDLIDFHVTGPKTDEYVEEKGTFVPMDEDYLDDRIQETNEKFRDSPISFGNSDRVLHISARDGLGGKLSRSNIQYKLRNKLQSLESDPDVDVHITEVQIQLNKGGTADVTCRYTTGGGVSCS